MQPRHVAVVQTVVKKLDITSPQEDIEMGDGSWELDSPENVELDELDGLFSGF